MKQIRRAAVAAAVGIVLAGVPAAATWAAPSPGTGIEVQRQEITRRIDARLTELTALKTTLGNAKQVTDAHRTTLTTLLDTDRSGLTALKTKVAGETTAAALKADATSMINDYRVFMLVGPQVRLTVSADLEAAAITKLTPVVGTLSDQIAAAKQAGKDTTKAEADLADLRAKLASATAAVSGTADTLLAVKPGPDADAITGQVTTVRQSIRTGKGDLKAAVADVRDIRTLLKG